MLLHKPTIVQLHYIRSIQRKHANDKPLTKVNSNTLRPQALMEPEHLHRAQPTVWGELTAHMTCRNAEENREKQSRKHKAVARLERTLTTTYNGSCTYNQRIDSPFLLLQYIMRGGQDLFSIRYYKYEQSESLIRQEEAGSLSRMANGALIFLNRIARRVEQSATRGNMSEVCRASRLN